MSILVYIGVALGSVVVLCVLFVWAVKTLERYV